MTEPTTVLPFLSELTKDAMLIVLAGVVLLALHSNRELRAWIEAIRDRQHEIDADAFLDAEDRCATQGMTVIQGKPKGELT